MSHHLSDVCVRASRQQHWRRGIVVDVFRYVTDTVADVFGGDSRARLEHLLPDTSDASCRTLEFQAYAPFEYSGNPTLQIDDTRAQQLMDDLWTCGLRPTEGAGSAGALAATQQHLKDMQAIAFKQLGISA
jgi:hypothetical protein